MMLVNLSVVPAALHPNGDNCQGIDGCWHTQELACDSDAVLGLAAEGGLVGALLTLVRGTGDAGGDARVLARAAAAVLATMDAPELPQSLSEVRPPWALDASCIRLGSPCAVPRDSPCGNSGGGAAPRALQARSELPQNSEVP